MGEHDHDLKTKIYGIDPLLVQPSEPPGTRDQETYMLVDTFCFGLIAFFSVLYGSIMKCRPTSMVMEVGRNKVQ